jgi:hypothetical protein
MKNIVKGITYAAFWLIAVSSSSIAKNCTKDSDCAPGPTLCMGCPGGYFCNMSYFVCPANNMPATRVPAPTPTPTPPPVTVRYNDACDNMHKCPTGMVCANCPRYPYTKDYSLGYLCQLAGQVDSTCRK